jgi:putative oxidoreductase
MLNHTGLTQIVGVLALVLALYYMRSWLARHALRGWRESHPHALAWIHRYRLLVELTEVSLAAVFFVVGGAKLIGRHDMIVLFQDIGVGQWLRYLTGTLEVAGAALLLVPLLSGASSVALGGIMVVATLIELFVLHRPPVAALACLSGHTFVAWARLSHSRGRSIQPIAVHQSSALLRTTKARWVFPRYVKLKRPPKLPAASLARPFAPASAPL